MNLLNGKIAFYLVGILFGLSNVVYSFTFSGLQSWLVLFSLIFVQFIAQMLLLRLNTTKRRFLFLICIGLLARFLIIGSDPWLEDDHYRYFWDGHVQNHGISPYFAPPNSPDLDPIDTSYRHLINYSEVPTVYPSVAQFVFRILDRLAPASTRAWQYFYLCLDLSLLVAFWRKRKLTRGFMLYWLSPFILKEFYNSIHIDFLVIQLLFFGLLWIRSRSWQNSLAVTLAGFVKIFPFLFLITDLFYERRKWRYAIGVPLILIVLIIGLDPTLVFVHQGLTQFTRYWTFNDGFFNILNLLTANQKIARLITWGLFGISCLLICRFEARLIQRRTLILAGLFFFSPVLNPWYFCWVVPLLCYRRNDLLYSLGLPLYLGYSFFVDPQVYNDLRFIQVTWILALFFAFVLVSWTRRSFIFKLNTWNVALGTAVRRAS